MRLLSLIVGLVLGFLGAAWFYGAGGALVIAGKQIGPDILQPNSVGGSVPAVTGNSGDGKRFTNGGGAGFTGGSGSPSSAGANAPPSGVTENSLIQLRWPK